MNIAQEDIADACRDLASHIDDPDMTDEELGNWLRVYRAFVLPALRTDQ